MNAFEEGQFSPHAAQLHRGFPWLRFEPELEGEFREYHVRRQLVQTRIALLAGAILFALFGLRDYRILPQEIWHLTLAVRLYVIVPVMLLLVVMTYVPMPGRRLEELGTAGVIGVMGASASVILISAEMGSPLPYEALLAVMVFVIFLTGLRFYQATLSTFGVATAYIVARFALELPAAETLKQALYIYVIVLIGSIGSYMLEWTRRANFLHGHIMLFRATHDPLTYLYNRRAALDHLQRTWKLAERERRPVAVLLLDVDYFKRFNDHYGHLHGDGCLSEVAMALHHRLRRPMDLVARYGGEEFLAVLYGVAGDSVGQVGEAVRQMVRDLGIVHAQNLPAGVVTVSVGACWAEPADPSVSIQSLLESADQALYRAKAAGRNRCEAQRAAPAAAAPGVAAKSPAAAR
ncbi:MAG: diguanylate cyclase domain-containing protein [Arenimonas sp.]